MMYVNERALSSSLKNSDLVEIFRGQAIHISRLTQPIASITTIDLEICSVVCYNHMHWMIDSALAPSEVLKLANGCFSTIINPTILCSLLIL